jgi:hypothetical protein
MPCCGPKSAARVQPLPLWKTSVMNLKSEVMLDEWQRMPIRLLRSPEGMRFDTTSSPDSTFITVQK